MINNDFSPNIEVKYEQLMSHIQEKSKTIDEITKVLKEMCDWELFNSRNWDKFANSISKLLIGRDPLKDVLITFQRMLATKSQQSSNLAQSIKEDLIPFITNCTLLKQQSEMKSKQKLVKDLRANMHRKIETLYFAQKEYQKCRSRRKAIFTDRMVDREKQLIESINIYNHTVQQYMLHYSGLCQQSQIIERTRKRGLKDSISKYMIFEMNSVKNIEYNISRYMQNLQKIDDKIIIEQQINNLLNNKEILHLAKIQPNNYIENISYTNQIQLSISYKKIIQYKQIYQGLITIQQYHKLMDDMNQLLNQAQKNNDVKLLKEIIRFSITIYVNIGQINKDTNKNISLKLLSAILCHRIFNNSLFWQEYQKRLNIIINSNNYQLLTPEINFLSTVNINANINSLLEKCVQYNDSTIKLSKNEIKNENLSQIQFMKQIIQKIDQFM